jgi:spermidine synthase
MQSVMRELQRRGFNLQSADVLECFAHTGKMHTIDYARAARSLTLWEINPIHEKQLRATFPKATVQITDTYRQVLRDQNRFDLIVIDTSPGEPGHFESFDLFPEIFRLAKDRCILILNVIPELNKSILKIYPNVGKDFSREARRRFYHIVSPERIPLKTMVGTYEEIAKDQGFRLVGHFARRRNRFSRYLVLDVIRADALT